MHRKILVVTNGSHASRLATLQANDLAKACDVEAQTIYVVDDREALRAAFIDRIDQLPTRFCAHRHGQRRPGGSPTPRSLHQ